MNELLSSWLGPFRPVGENSLYPALLSFSTLFLCAVLAYSVLPSRVSQRNARLKDVLEAPKIERSAIEARRLAESLYHLKRMWSQNGKLFKDWWSDLPKEEREEFLLGICLFMPEDRSRLSAVLYGNEAMPTDIVPEWNLKEMLQGMRLPRFVEEHAELSDCGEKCGAISKLVARELPMARQLMRHSLIKTQLEPSEHQNGFVAILPNCFGVHGFTNEASVRPMVQQRVRDGAILWSREWEAVARRVDLQLQMLITCMEHFYIENLDPKGGKSFGVHAFASDVQSSFGKQ